MPGLPVGVLQEDRDKLAGFQRQIKILVNNHQILVCRSEKNPQDQQIIKQIEDVKNYLIHFTEQQSLILSKVRSYLERLEEKTNQQEPTDLGPPLIVPIKQESKLSASQTKSNGKQKSKSRKDKRKSVKNSRSTSPESLSDEESDPVFLAYFESDTCYRGHIEEYDILCSPAEENENIDDFGPEEEVNFGRVETHFGNVEKKDFMLNIDLLTETQHKMVLGSLEEQKKRKGQKRPNIYIPEVSDKKIRYQNFLQTSIVSPPHLRRRKPSQLPSAPPKPVKAHSFPESTFALPSPVEKMETRNKTPNFAKLVQVDGAVDIDCFDDISKESDCDIDLGDEIVEEKEPGYDINERLKVRDELLIRKKMMEDEIEMLESRKIYLQEYRDAKQEENLKMLKEQKLLEERIKILLHILRQASI